MRFRRAILPLLFLALLATPAAAQKAQRHRAAIDMGSSSIKLLVVDASGRTVVAEKIGAALGKGIGPDRLRPRANRERAVAALQHFVTRAGRYGVPPNEIELIATAAVR